MKSNLFTIPANVPFADALAAWALKCWGHSPLLLSRACILVPSRRAVLSLREAFLRQSEGEPLLLPRIAALGDADEDALLSSPLASLPPQEEPTAQFDLRRLFLLARLVRHQRTLATGRTERMDHALKLAQSLADLLDECEREDVPLDGLMRIVPDRFAAHWQVTVEFLHIVSRHWPEIAAAEGLTSPARHQRRMLLALADHWRETPPEAPVIAAGTTGSIPSTARLLASIAAMKQGYIVFPGLDMQADESYFAHLDESHPQWGMTRLLATLGRTRAEVQAIGAETSERVRLMSEIMRPAEISDAWRAIPPFTAEATHGLEIIDCADAQEEASVIALLLRETLEQDGKTAALVTPNRPLARRVAAIMRRFGVVIDDSAGMALRETPPGAFLRLILDAATASLAPLPLLSLLKHPFAHAGMERIACLSAVRALELLALRGLRIEGGIDALRQALLLQSPPPDVHGLLDRLEDAFAPLLALMRGTEVSLGACLDAHIACAQALGHEAMWSGEAGEALLEFTHDLRGATAKDALRIEGESYPAVFEELIYGKVVRPEYGMHPRLKILSPREARMQAFDRMVLGGLNEGSWPPAPASDPWFNRPMRTALGLPSPERALGLAAHDFFMLACGSQVFLTRAAREGGAPAQPSRWLVKLRMLAGDLAPRAPWAAWAQALDRPEKVTPISPPEPRPPLAARPGKVSVTEVDSWMRDPYAFYAAKILRLRALDALGRAPDASDFGNAVHKALEDFTVAHPEKLPADALGLLLGYGRQAFAPLFAATAMEPLWWPRFARIAEWVIAAQEQRPPVTRILSEAKGTLRLGELLLHGRADRIEQRADGGIVIVDYKTGGVPPLKDIMSGLSNQLVLLALMAREGDIGVRGERVELEYWQLQGAEEAGDIKAIAADKIEALMAAAREGMARLIARYADPDFPYRPTPIPARAGRYSDYGHLARVKEWG